MTSVAVATPGIDRHAELAAARDDAALRPGVTMNRAPASTASSTCSGRTTVPAPTSMSPSAASARIAAGRGGGAEGDLGDGQPAGAQRARQRQRGASVVEYDDRDDAARADGRQSSGGSHAGPAVWWASSLSKIRRSQCSPSLRWMRSAALASSASRARSAR